MTATLATVANAKNGQAIASDKTTNVGERYLKMMRPIKVLHRHDGCISFAVRGEDVQWKQVISIRANALDDWFPQFTEQLLRDSQRGHQFSVPLALARLGETLSLLFRAH